MTVPNCEPDLWRRLSALELDTVDAALPFSRRLAEENGWSMAFAERALAEYKRFVFLAMVAGHPVTPSDEVDQVWHLHLCYTRSYWDELCGSVLPRPLHHGPTRGGAAERGKFDTWYRQTLASYERVFGERPPSRWWPTPAHRFAPRRWRRVDVGASLLVPRRGAAMAAALLLVLLLPACTDMGGWLALGAILSVVAIPAVIIWIASRHEFRRTGGDSGCGGAVGCGAGRRDEDHADGDSDDGGDAGCGGDGCGGGCGD